MEESSIFLELLIATLFLDHSKTFSLFVAICIIVCVSNKIMIVVSTTVVFLDNSRLEIRSITFGYNTGCFLL